MAQAINAPLNVQFQNNRQLTQQIQASINAVRFNFGGGSRSLNSLSQPLGRLTGQADEFTKSLDAANARVLAFGASVGIVNAFSNAFKSLVASTIEVEKAIKAITVVGDQFNGKTKQLSQGLFNVAKVTGQSFAEVSKAALEFSRQGLGVEQTLQRTQDALILTRLTGLDAAKSVEGLTAAVNGFTKAGLTTTQILNKLAAVDQAFAVSSADLIEGFNRSAAVAENAGVTFDELAGIITSLQQQTSRGGAVIGNALKTIFTRLQDTSTLNQLRNLGVAVQDLEGNLLPARQILQNLATDVEGLGQITRAGIFKDVAGTFQINQLISLVSDLGKQNSIAASATQKAAGATNEAFVANEKLNQSLDAILNKVATTGKQLGSLLGEIGLSDSLKGILDGISSFLDGATKLLQGDDLGSRFAKGIIKGIGAVLTGPGLGIFLAVIAKLTLDLVKFGTQSVKTFFGIGKAAKEQQLVQEAIVQTLLREQGVLNRILSAQGGQNAQAREFLNILNQQQQALQNIRTLAGGIAAPLIGAGYGIGPQGGIQRRGRAAGGYLPAQEASDVRRGVGGASPSSKVVAIPNFAFGGGKRGTMIANTSEYIVPNYAGGGSAIFNQDMVKTMGLPPGAKKIGAAGGFVPNFRGIKGLQGRSIKYNPSKYIEDSFLQDLNNDKAPVILAGRIFESLSNGDSFINLYENETKADIQKGAYRIAEAKLSIEAGLKDSRLGIEEEKGGKGNKLLVPLSAKVTESGQQKLEQRGIKLVKHKTLTHPLLFSKAREIIAQYKNKSNIPNKIKIASNGYVPNFANYVYDSDRLGSGKNEILQAILDSTVTKNLLVGPAGSGKSTAAAGLGTFIKSIDDVRKASSFTILSAAGLSKEGGFSTSFQNILNAVKSSGGKTTYLGTTNEELKRRRASRTASEGDLRSQAQLAGTAYAPLNQSAFIKQLKKGSGNFEMMRSGKGGFTNNQLAVLGLYGENSPTGIDGSPIYTLESRGADLARNIKGEYETYVKSFVAEYSQELANKIGVTRTPKEVKKAIQQSSSISGFIFEDVLNQLAGDFDTNSISGGARADFRMTGQLRSVFKAGQEKYAEAKLNPYTSDAAQSVRDKQLALAAGATDIFDQAPKQKGLSQRPIKVRNSNFESQLAKYGGSPFNFQSAGLNEAQIKKLVSAGGIQTNAALGYIPNFAASALQEAIAREKSAGLSSSQIYVDQSSALKSPSNPMGLMVANTRDEPAGGFQGIARARKEGANPKLYGAAKGFVPNFFSFVPGSSQYGSGPTANPQTQVQNNTQQTKQTKAIQDSIGSLISLQIASTALTGILSEAGETAQKFGTAIGGALIGLQSIKELGKTEGGVSFGNLLDFKRSRSSREITAGFSRLGTANRTRSLSTLASGLGLVTKGFLRFAPLIGQVVLGFDILNGVLKVFNVDIVKSFTNAFRGVNDAGQKAKESIENFAKILEEGGGKISGEGAFEILSKRASALLEENRFKTAGLSPKSEEEKVKARIDLINKDAEESIKRLTGKDIANKIIDVGATTQTSSAFAKSLQASYIESFSVIQNLDEESIKNIAKNKGISGKDFAETKNNVLKAIIGDLDQQLKTAKALGGESEEDITNYFRELSATNIFGRTAKILAKTPEQIKAFEGRLEQNVEAVLQSEQQFFNRINRELANAVDLFSSATSTKTFSSLGIGEQTNFLNALDIGKSQQNFIKGLTDFRAQAANTLLGEFRQRGLTSGLNQEQQGKIEDFILSFDPSNVKTFNEELNNFVARLGGVNKEGFNKLQETANGLSEQQADLISKRTNEIKLLGFTIDERNRETKAIQYFNKEVVKFGSSIVEAEKEIQNLNSQIKILDLQSDFETSISDAFALSSDEALSKRQSIELKSAQDKARIEAQINEKQARIDLQRTLFTKENTVALNRNTEMLKELLDIQSLVQENSLKQEKEKLASKFTELTGTSIDDLLLDLSPEASNLQKQYNQISNVIKAIEDRKTVSSTNLAGVGGINAQGGVNTKFFPSIDELIAGYKDELTAGKSPEDAIQSYVTGLNYSEEASLIVRDALLEYSRTLDKSGNAAGNLQIELERAQELERNKNDLLSTYAATLSAQVKQGQDALRNPSTMGEFAAQQNANKLAMEALRISERGIENPQALRQNNPEEYRRLTEQNNPAVREFLSSGRYGFSEGLSEIEKQTLDFRKELGQEIPRLFSQNLAQGLNDAITGAKSLKEALTDAATSFFQAITQKNIENIANLFTVGGGKAAQSILPGLASGGMIKGGSGAKDDVPAMLMGGEYVMKKSAVNKYGSSFFDALNSGKIKGFANGGGVQSGAGGFYVPGEYGTGGIRGKRELLSFATQSFTGGQYDSAGGFGMSGASVSLEPESMRLSQIGRQNNPMFERVQETKQQAFDLYLQQLKQESQYQDQLKQMEEADKQREKQLVTSIVSAVASAVVSVGAKAFATGAENAVAQAGAEAGKPLTGLSKLGTGFMGGLKNLGALVPGGAKPTFELNNFAKETRLFDAVGFNKTFPPIYSSGTFTSGSYEWSPSKGNYGRVGRAAGGMVYGGSGMRDDVPAMLTGGEFVLNNRATRKLGVQNLNRLNAGETGGEDRSGAITESLLSKLDELIQATRESSGDNVVVNVNSSESGGSNEQSMAGNEKELQRKIRQAVLDVIAQEKRLGGSLNKNN
jgi:TP901 family phage tail tape measure protein